MSVIHSTHPHHHHEHSTSTSSSPLTSISSSNSDSEHSPLPIIRLPIPKIQFQSTMSSTSTPTSTSRPSFATYPTYQSPSTTTPIPSPSPRHPTLDRSIRPNPQRHGHIPNVLPGTVWPNRFAVSQAGVHAPVQAGISGHVKRGGAESVVLNGGYPYGDSGDIIWYMGAGGRKNPETNKKSSIMQCDQTLDRTGNKAMEKSLHSRLPVRVIRGPNADDSPWAPIEGYRYDGLYRVANQISTVDPSHQTNFICYVWRMERIVESDMPKYEIPIRPGQHAIAKERARLGLMKQIEEEKEKLAQSLRDAGQSPLKRSSGFSCSGNSKRYKREDSSSNQQDSSTTHKRQDHPSSLPTSKNRHRSTPQKHSQSVASTSNHRPDLSSTQQAKRPIYKEHKKGQIFDTAFGWNGLDGAQVENVLNSMAFRKKPTTIYPSESQSKPDEVILPKIARPSVKISLSSQTGTLDGPISNIDISNSSQTNSTNRDQTTSTSTSRKLVDPLLQPHLSRAAEDRDEISDQPTLTNETLAQDLMDTLPKSKSMLDALFGNEDDEVREEKTEAQLAQSRLADQPVSCLEQCLASDPIEAYLEQSLPRDQIEAQPEQSRSTEEIDLDTSTSSSIKMGGRTVGREQTTESSESEPEDDFLNPPSGSKMDFNLASPICLSSSPKGHSPPALNSSPRYGFHEDDKSSTRRPSPIEEEDDGYGEDPQTLRDIKMMMEEEDDDDEDREPKESLKPEGSKAPLFRDPSMIEGEEEEIIPEISTDDTSLSNRSSTDLLIRPIQADQPRDLVLGFMVNQIKDPADGCMVVYDHTRGKYMVGEFEIEDSDDEREAMKKKVEVKDEEDEDANLLDLIDD